MTTEVMWLNKMKEWLENQTLESIEDAFKKNPWFLATEVLEIEEGARYTASQFEPIQDVLCDFAKKHQRHEITMRLLSALSDCCDTDFYKDDDKEIRRIYAKDFMSFTPEHRRDLFLTSSSPGIRKLYMRLGKIGEIPYELLAPFIARTKGGWANLGKNKTYSQFLVYNLPRWESHLNAAPGIGSEMTEMLLSSLYVVSTLNAQGLDGDPKKAKMTALLNLEECDARLNFIRLLFDPGSVNAKTFNFIRFYAQKILETHPSTYLKLRFLHHPDMEINDDVVVHLVKEKQQHWQNVFFRILAHADLKLKMEDQTAKKISQCFDMCAFDSFGEKFKIQRATIHNMMKPANLKSRDSRLQGKRGAKYTFYTPICNTTLATSLEFEKLKSRVEKYALSKHTLTNSPERLCAL